MHASHLKVLTIGVTGKVTWFTSSEGILTLSFSFYKLERLVHQPDLRFKNIIFGIPPPDTVHGNVMYLHIAFAYSLASDSTFLYFHTYEV